VTTIKPPIEGSDERLKATAEQATREAESEASAAEIALLEAPAVVANSFREYATAWWLRVRSGDSGMLPVIGALIVITVIFQVQNSLFLSAGNIVNLFIFASIYIMFGIGEVFVLLLGEIDLSVGFVAGIGAGLMAALVASPINAPWWLAILAGLGATTTIGLIQGTLITRLGLPSFIVTLAGLIGWEGVLIWMFDRLSVAVGGVISVSNGYIVDIVSGNLSPIAGWITMAAVVVAYGALTIFRDTRRRAAGLVAPPPGLTVVKVGLATIAGVLLVLVCNTNRGLNTSTLHTTVEGVPWAIPIILVIVLAASFLLNRTRFGRYIYAIGGSAEAARRAGVNLARIRTAAFGLAGLMAGIAGIIYTSFLQSIAIDIDGGTLVLYAVAAAVIGGTSLFGGRGKPLHAVLGGIVIAAIANGLALIGASAAATYMVTALVLLVAVAVDSIARRGQGATSRGKV
jgi:D-xylose transport system permease protein